MNQPGYLIWPSGLAIWSGSMIGQYDWAIWPGYHVCEPGSGISQI